MEPKFQSSFIPKGPIATSGKDMPTHEQGKSLLSIIAGSIFALAVVLSLAVFGYNYFLSYKISQTGMKLDAAKAAMDTTAINELIRLDARLNSIEDLLNRHVALSPLFAFLEESTLRSVRFTELSYSATSEGISLRMAGQARGYSAVALQSEAFTESRYFINPVFSDLRLNDEGDVVFTLNTNVSPELISYQRLVERETLLNEPDFTEETEEETSSGDDENDEINGNDE